MRKYRVIYKPSVEDQLIDIQALVWGLGWNLQDVLKLMDKDLSLQPWDVGESRSGVTRIYIVERIGLHYDVIEDDKIVYVLDAKFI